MELSIVEQKMLGKDKASGTFKYQVTLVALMTADELAKVFSNCNDEGFFEVKL